MALYFTYEVQVSCTPARLIGLIAETLAETMGNIKPADLVRGSSGCQRVSERGSEGSSGMNGKRVALSETSITSITRLTKEVNERSNDAH